jgi:hypothetical protein
MELDSARVNVNNREAIISIHDITDYQMIRRERLVKTDRDSGTVSEEADRAFYEEDARKMAEVDLVLADLMDSVRLENLKNDMTNVMSEIQMGGDSWASSALESLDAEYRRALGRREASSELKDAYEAEYMNIKTAVVGLKEQRGSLSEGWNMRELVMLGVYQRLNSMFPLTPEGALEILEAGRTIFEDFINASFASLADALRESPLVEYLYKNYPTGTLRREMTEVMEKINNGEEINFAYNIDVYHEKVEFDAEKMTRIEAAFS